jgi:anti-anti-sigma regulatory factor
VVTVRSGSGDGASVCASGRSDPAAFDVQRREVADRPHAFEVTVAGEVDSATVGGLDASAVTFLDSSGLRAIVRAGNALAERDGRLTCAGLSGAATKVLEISGLLEQLRDRAPAP